MTYQSISEMAKRWNMPTRTIRYYCQIGRIPGAFLTGKTWNIPSDAEQPPRQRNIQIDQAIHVDNRKLNIAIVGGGISGVFAAIRLKEKHPFFHVSIFEKNNKLLRKIYVTGNGRCNFANRGDLKGKYNHESFVLPIINEFSFSKISRYFETLGIHHKFINDLVYPLSETAETVALLLLKKVEELNIEVHVNEKVIDYQDHHLFTEQGSYHFDYLVLAGGGKAAPQLGSDGNLLTMLINHGYRIVDNQPSLCPIKVKENVNLIEGLRAKAQVILLIDDKEVHSEEGEVLFKKDGLSGIVIFNMTHFINQHPSAKKVEICLNFVPQMSNLPKKQYIEYLHPRLANYLLNHHFDIHHTVFTFKSLYDFNVAQVTSGGVSLKEVNNSLISQHEKDIFFIGEMLDVDAVCGGFNIMWALASAEKISNNHF